MKQKVSYKQILDAVTDYLVQDVELQFNRIDIHPTLRLSRDLKMDDATKIQAIKYVEETLNIEQIDEDKILKRRFGNLAEFCLAIKQQINEPVAEQPAIKDQPKTTEEIFKTINKFLYETYGIYYATPNSNWFKDFGKTEFELYDLYGWSEKTFGVKIPYFYFKNLNTLCEVILLEIKKQQVKKAVAEKRKKFINKIKNTFIKTM